MGFINFIEKINGRITTKKPPSATTPPNNATTCTQYLIQLMNDRITYLNKVTISKSSVYARDKIVANLQENIKYLNVLLNSKDLKMYKTSNYYRLLTEHPSLVTIFSPDWDGLDPEVDCINLLPKKYMNNQSISRMDQVNTWDKIYNVMTTESLDNKFLKDLVGWNDIFQKSGKFNEYKYYEAIDNFFAKQHKYAGEYNSDITEW